MNNEGMLVIISGPSGSGKGTVVKKLKPIDGYALSISVTTRQKRPGEEHGKDYFFCTNEEYFAMLNAEELLEHATFCGNCYGTPKKYVAEQVELGKNVILEIDVIGALQIKEKFPSCILIFLMPPTLEELSNRLKSRGTEDDEVIANRLKRASEEIKLITKYDYIVINDKVEQAVSDIDLLVRAEKMRPSRNLNKIESFKGVVL